MTAKEVKGVGIWANPELFEKSAGLPVVKAIRGITTNLIKTRLENDPQIVFSIGIGPGIMYKDFIEKFTDHSLRLLGIDVLPDMLNKTIETIGQGRVVEEFSEASQSEAVVLSIHDVRENFGLPSSSVNVVEAGLILHHILERETLVEIMRRINAVLKPNGIFVLGDIDVAIGEYIDQKKHILQQQFSSVAIDMDTGEFIGLNGQSKRIKILDPKNGNDQLVLDRMDEITCKPLEQEMRLHNPTLQEPIFANIANAHKGLEWHRAIDGSGGWLSIVSEGFLNCQIQTIRPSEIKKEFSSVLDNPFVIVVTKV